MENVPFMSPSHICLNMTINQVELSRSELGPIVMGIHIIWRQSRYMMCEEIADTIISFLTAGVSPFATYVKLCSLPDVRNVIEQLQCCC